MKEYARKAILYPLMGKISRFPLIPTGVMVWSFRRLNSMHKRVLTVFHDVIICNRKDVKMSVFQTIDSIWSCTEKNWCFTGYKVTVLDRALKISKHNVPTGK